MRYGMVEVVVELPSWQKLRRFWGSAGEQELLEICQRYASVRLLDSPVRGCRALQRSSMFCAGFLEYGQVRDLKASEIQ